MKRPFTLIALPVAAAATAVATFAAWPEGEYPEATVSAPTARELSESLPAVGSGEQEVKCPTADAAAAGASCPDAGTESTGASGAVDTSSSLPAGPESGPSSPSSGGTVPTPSTAPVAPQPDADIPANSVARGALPVSLGETPPEYVKQCESGGDYGAVNRSSGAGGAWQILPSTWAGYGGYARAEDAPPEVQDAKAAELWAGGRGASHWEACL